MTIDEIDRSILKRLLTNARTKMIDIAKDCEVSITTIINRIERLKKEGIIVKEELIIDPTYFGYRYPVSIGINLEPDQEDNICNLIGEKAKIFDIDHFIGIYDVHIFAYVKTLEDLQALKRIIQKHKGVNEIEILLWNKAHFRFDNFQLQKAKG